MAQRLLAQRLLALSDEMLSLPAGCFFDYVKGPRRIKEV